MAGTPVSSIGPIPRWSFVALAFVALWFWVDRTREYDYGTPRQRPRLGVELVIPDGFDCDDVSRPLPAGADAPEGLDSDHDGWVCDH